MSQPPESGPPNPLGFLEQLPPDEQMIIAQHLARLAQTGGMSGAAMGQAGPRDHEPDLPALPPSTLYEPRRAPRIPLEKMAEQLASKMLARGRQNPKFLPQFEMVEPSIRHRRQDNHPLSYRNKHGQVEQAYTRPRDRAIDHPEDTPTVIRRGWKLASRFPVGEHQYIQARRYDGSHANQNPVKEVGIFLDEDGTLLVYQVPKLKVRPKVTTGTNPDGTPFQEDMHNSAYTGLLRHLNPYQPHIFDEDSQVQAFHLYGSEGGIIPVSQAGNYQADEVIARMTEVAAGGQRNIGTIIQDFADENGITL